MEGDCSKGQPSAPTPILILGVGNLLVGDEGVGIHVIQMLEKEAWPAHVSLLDGGTGGFHLLEPMRTFGRIILIDATIDGQPEGSVRSFPARVPRDFPASLGAHDIGLRDLLATTAILGPLPEIQVVTVSVHTLEPMTLELSPAVASALPRVGVLVRSFVDDWERTGSIYTLG